MIFSPMASLVPNTKMWGAARGDRTFIVSLSEDNEIHASVKLAGLRPFEGTRIDLGMFKSIDAAMDACRKWKA